MNRFRKFLRSFFTRPINRGFRQTIFAVLLLPEQDTPLQMKRFACHSFFLLLIHLDYFWLPILHVSYTSCFSQLTPAASSEGSCDTVLL